jgi:acyl-CoA synthetase (AMP-forming)/AMP-acid ligase II
VLGAFGALSAGATLVPVSTRFTGPEALDVIRRSGASALIVADRFLGIDRLAALCEAAEGQAAESARARATTESPIVEERNLAGGPVTPGKLRLVVRVPMPDPAERGTATGPEGHQLGGAAGPGGHGARWRGGTERRSGAPR